MRLSLGLLKGIMLSLSILLLSACLSSGGGGNNVAPEPTRNKPLVYLGAAAIGVSDLEASVALYTDGLGMREISRITRDNRIEVTLESADKRGSYVTLMSFTDNIGRIYNQNPGKLVFYARDAVAFAQAFANAGGTVTVPPQPQPAFGNVVVGFGRDLDNNLIEMVGDSAATASYFGAMGIGVSNLEEARDFYVEVIGFEESQFLAIPGQYDEYILTSPVPGSSALVLMNWTNGSQRNYLDNPVKLELRVAYPTALAEDIEAAGETVLRQPTPSEEADLLGQIVGYAEDADGTLLEIRQGVRAYLGAAGIGVEDLAEAEFFYTSGLGMQVVERRSRDDRNEVVLESADARGSLLVLMEFTDVPAPNTRQNYGKLVFYVNDPAAFAQGIVTGGGIVTVAPVVQPPFNLVIGFGRDPDNNLIEFVGIPGTADSYLSAFGIGVSNLEASKDFYVDQLGFKVDQYLSIPQLYDEYILTGQGGSALVLMRWLDGYGYSYSDKPVKLEMRSMSPEGFAEAVEAGGGEITQAPVPSTEADREGDTVGYGADLDGTVLEILRAPWTL